jgi:hypothetical protein
MLTKFRGDYLGRDIGSCFFIPYFIVSTKEVKMKALEVEYENSIMA